MLNVIKTNAEIINIMSKNNYLFIAIITLIFTSCISTNKLMNLPSNTIKNVSFEYFNSNYSNKDIENSLQTLWELLYECKTLKNDTTKITDNTYINISFNKNILTVKAINDTSVLNSFELEEKIVDNYFSVKRKLILVPIPFIYFRHSERKVLLGIGLNGNLIVKNGVEENLWILMAGGYSGESSNEYEELIFDKNRKH